MRFPAAGRDYRHTQERPTSEPRQLVICPETPVSDTCPPSGSCGQGKFAEVAHHCADFVVARGVNPSDAC